MRYRIVFLGEAIDEAQAERIAARLEAEHRQAHEDLPDHPHAHYPERSALEFERVNWELWAEPVKTWGQLQAEEDFDDDEGGEHG